jgi:hypothetical protein
MVARRHHFVPLCYLKGFSVPRRQKSQRVIVFDRPGRKVYNAGIENIAVEKDFNTVEIDGQPPDVFEQGMAGFESELAPALKRIIDSRSLQDVDDRAYLLNFIALQCLRNPRKRETFRDFHERVAKATMNLALSTPEMWASQVKKATEAGHMNPDADTSYEKMKEFMERGEFTVEVATERHIILEMGNFDKILPYFFNRGWALLRASEDSGGFVTSDHPFCLIWSDPPLRRGIYPPGLGLKNTEIVFPVSARLAVIGAFEIENDELDVQQEFVAAVNGTIINFAQRQVFARDMNFHYSFQEGEQPRKASRLIDDARFLRTRRKQKNE